MSESLTPESATHNGSASNGQSEPSQAHSPADQETIKRLLTEARSTRDVLGKFRSAIEAGTFSGSKIVDLAKGLAFLDAILMQNRAHIINLQGRE